MRESFHRQLDSLKTNVLRMAALARSMLADGMRSLDKLDADLAAKVIERSAELARFDDDIEEQALLLVARQQPMARDLRSIAAGLKLITYINRIGRYGRDIAQIAAHWGSMPHRDAVMQLPPMADLALRMFDEVVGAYSQEKPINISQISQWENQLDATRWGAFHAFLARMIEDPDDVEPGVHYMMVARYLERCGDNICKMGEKTQYMVTGERITLR